MIKKFSTLIGAKGSLSYRVLGPNELSSHTHTHTHTHNTVS